MIFGAGNGVTTLGLRECSSAEFTRCRTKKNTATNAIALNPRINLRSTLKIRIESWLRRPRSLRGLATVLDRRPSSRSPDWSEGLNLVRALGLSFPVIWDQRFFRFRLKFKTRVNFWTAKWLLKLDFSVSGYYSWILLQIVLENVLV